MLVLIPILLGGYHWIKEKNTHAVTNVPQWAHRHHYLPRTLEAEKILKAVKNIRTKKKNTPVVMVLGIGGSGKTTLAKLCRHHLKPSLVWTLNASSQEALLLSYILFAKEVVGEDPKRQETLNKILKILDKKNKLREIVALVHRELKKQEWLLIFDNLNMDMKTLSPFFPLNANQYGKGTIILTTQNSNIQHTAHVDYTFQLGALNQEEAYKLFTSIRNYKDPIEEKKKSDIQSFLKEIPPFPLDIVLAAHYLKLSSMSLKTYLQRMQDFSLKFDSLQKDILSNVSSCKHTRYEIIALSLQNLMKEHPDFKGILQMISLMNAQNIPLELLYRYKDPVTVDRLIYSMNRYSFVMVPHTNASVVSTIALHTSTLENIRTYFKRQLSEADYEKEALRVAEIFMDYMSEVLYTNEAVILSSFLIQHAPILLEKIPFLGNKLRAEFLFQMALTNRFLGNFQKAMEQVQDSIAYSRETKNYNNLVNAMAYLGELYCVMGLDKKARTLLEQSIYISEKHKTRELPIKSYIYLGEALVHLGEHAKAKHYFEGAVRLAKELGVQHRVMSAKVRLARYYAKIGNDEKAIVLFNQCKAYYDRQKIPYRIAKVDAHLGQSYFHRGDIIKAKDLYESALDYYEKSNDKLRIAWLCNKLAKLSITLEEYERAHRLLKRAIGLNKKYSVLKEVAKSEAYLGFLDLRLGRYAQAEELLIKSLNFKRTYYGEKYIGTLFLETLLGALYSHKGEHKKGLAIQERFLKKFKELYGSNHYMYGNTLGEIAYSYYLADDLETAERYAKESLEIRLKAHTPDIFKIYETLGYIYYKRWKHTRSKAAKRQAHAFFKKATTWSKEYLPKGSNLLKHYPI